MDRQIIPGNFAPGYVMLQGWIQVGKRAQFSDSRLAVVEMEGVVSISTPWEKHWGMEEVKGVLANESSHEIQTETAVYYFLDVWHPTAKISLFILRKGDTDPSWEMFLIWT